MTDREHRIDTGSPEERVREKYPNIRVHWSAYNVWLESDGKVLESIRRPLLADDTGIAQRYEPRLWKRAANRLETK